MEKLSEEVKLFEDMVKFMEKISMSNEKVTMDDREFLSVARNNVNGVHRELCTVISSSSAIDVSLIIKDYRSKVEKELNDICNKVSNLNIKADIKDYIQSFQHDDAVIDDDDNEISAYFKKWNKLYLECEDYEQTLEFLNKLKVIATKEQASEKDLSILNRAYNMIMRVYRALSDTLYSDRSSSVWDIDVSLTVNESRSKVQNELNYICNNVTNHTIKEAISRHLDAFKAGHLPQKLFPRILTDRKRVSSQSDIKTTNKKSKLGSGDGFGYHDHVKSIKKQRVPLYIQINAVFEDSEPDCIGEGFEIQHVDDKSEMALVQHFLMEPLSFTVKGLLDEVVSLDYCSSPLLFCERLEGNLLQCLHEAGKKQKTTLLDLYYEALDPKLYNLRHSDHLELKPDSQRPSWIQGINGTSSKMQKGGLIGQTIRQVRDFSPAALLQLVEKWSKQTDGFIEIHEKVKELQLQEKIEGDNLKEPANKSRRQTIRNSGNLDRSTKNLNDKAAALISCMTRDHMQPIECIPFHEIVCFKNVDKLQAALCGDPRRRIQLDLLECHNFLKCSCCSKSSNAPSSSMHDTTLMYTLAQEHGDLINLHDWYQSFRAIILQKTVKERHRMKVSPSPKKRKMTAEPQNITEASVQARFCRAVTELQITGLLRMPSKRRPDFVQRVAFGL